jgi:hypothetical protein
MTTGTFTQSLTEGLTAHARFLSRFRKVRIAEAWAIVAATCRENIEASQGDEDSIGYWKAALAIAQRAEITESDPRWSP